MNERHTHKMLPMTFDGWDEAGGDFGDIQFYAVEWLADFGPWKKGEKTQCLSFFSAKGVVAEYSEEGKRIVEVEVKLVVGTYLLDSPLCCR